VYVSPRGDGREVFPVPKRAASVKLVRKKGSVYQGKRMG